MMLLLKSDMSRAVAASATDVVVDDAKNDLSLANDAAADIFGWLV